jgi:EAL domain-containing protein (putative c-di-GMP-specific phosphodiesterase class I)/CHASE2 domain-containing sensor protein
VPKFPALSRAARDPGGSAAVAPDGYRRILLRTLVVATMVAVLIGAVGFAQPLDDALRFVRNKLRVQPPSREIVVVGIDDQSLEQLGSWPWPRQRHADLIDRLKSAGARRIFFDISFATKTDRREDAAFKKALAKAGNVYLAAMRTRDLATGKRRFKEPRPEFREHASVVSVAVTQVGAYRIRNMEFANRFSKATFPTMASVLAGREGANQTDFVIDYAIDLRSIPFYRAADVLTKSINGNAFKNKDVVVGATASELGDQYTVPGYGQVYGVFVQVVAAETLKAGGTRSIPWMIPVGVAALLATAHLLSRRRLLRFVALVLAIFAMTVLPFIAELRGIFFDIVPFSVLFGSCAIAAAWVRFRLSYKVRGNINSISGLPNLNALREEGAEAAILIGARVRNFAEISSSLPPEDERALVNQIVARLALGARGARIFQGDEGIFVWSSTPDVSGPDQLDALHALFRSPALVDGRPIDLSVTFGVDSGLDRTLANRIGATLVAADEAAAEGARWKAYDPAKLADAEWKLSLLGRLDAAIDTGEVWVAYQPQVDLKTGRITGAEALVRWSHPEKGEVSPVEFVLAAEQHDRIDKLTAFVLEDAIKTGAAFAARGIAFDVAVNISARLLEKPGLVDMVRRHLADSGLSPDRLTLEVTESAALTNGRASIRTLEEIGSLGINVSIDDYGTGFSTLEYFKKIPATEVKIDRSFVAAIDRNASDRLMVRSTIELAHSLGRSVVAEGVETQAILTELTNLGCDKAQGYLIGRPMKLISLTKLILAESRTRAA